MFFVAAWSLGILRFRPGQFRGEDSFGLFWLNNIFESFYGRKKENYVICAPSFSFSSSVGLFCDESFNPLVADRDFTLALWGIPRFHFCWAPVRTTMELNYFYCSHEFKHVLIDVQIFIIFIVISLYIFSPKVP